MHKTTIVILLALAVGSISDRASAQSLTIPEMIERTKPYPLEVSKSVDWALPKFNVAVRDADLIVQGTLTSLKVYLSEDQKTLYTDYLLTAQRHIASRIDLKSSTSGYVIRAWGGETVINGTNVKFDTRGELPMPTDTPVLVFLTFNKEIQKYEIYPGYIFELIAGGQLKPRITQPGVVDPLVVGRNITDVVGDIQARRP